MSGGEARELGEWEALLARVLRAPDPAGALAAAVADPAVPDAVRAWARAIDADGLRIGARLVARLRAERLLDGDDDARALFAADGAAFAALFARYHAEVPGAWSPGEEAARWRVWRGG